MYAIRQFFLKSHIRSSLASLIFGAILLAIPSFAAAQAYEGSEFCAECHETQFNQWAVSGHPYKLMKGSEAKFRPIPLPAGHTWDDISYVIGGYKWKSRYLDQDGYIITSVVDPILGPVAGQNQYNNLTGTWSNYHPGEVDLPYDCGSCHTTGWVADTDAATDGTLSDNQDGLPGIHGTFEFGGIQCEACHGPGMGSMNIDDSAAFCGTCHARGAPDAIPASGGFIRHQEQYNEFLASPHAALKCVSCHNPHKKAEFSIVTECESCHADEAASYALNSMSDYGVECQDCHMPFALKSALALGPHQGDVKSHLFSINTDPAANMFTPDGNFVALDGAGKGAATLDFVCQRCHQTADINELAKFAKNFHNQTLADIGLNPGLSGNWYGGMDRSGEGFLLEVGYTGASLYFFASFYTYDTAGKQVWLIAEGLITGGTTVNVNVWLNEGRLWGDGFNPADGSETPWGAGTFTFSSCTAGSFALTPNQAMKDRGFTNVAYGLERLLTPGIQCPTFNDGA